MGLKTRVRKLEVAVTPKQPEDIVIRVCDSECTCEECDLTPVPRYPVEPGDLTRVSICRSKAEVSYGA